jgi:putative ABC transport system permease protein
LGTTIASEFKKKVGDTMDLPVRPPDAKPDFVNHRFTVVGVLEPTRTAPDNYAYVSTPDAQMLLKDSLPVAIRESVDATKMASGFTVYAKPGTSLSELDRIAGRINEEVPGVKATRPSDLVNAFKSFGAIYTAITTGAAILALVIGGLSVVNTMIMAVTERFREIGLKKAVGAHTGHVLREYLAEATLIGLIGGAVGYLLGVLVTNAINAAGRSSNLELFLITPTLTVIAIGFSVALGALAGVIPALRAARLDPVTALRTTN